MNAQYIKLASVRVCAPGMLGKQPCYRIHEVDPQQMENTAYDTVLLKKLYILLDSTNVELF